MLQRVTSVLARHLVRRPSSYSAKKLHTNPHVAEDGDGGIAGIDITAGILMTMGLDDLAQYWEYGNSEHKESEHTQRDKLVLERGLIYTATSSLAVLGTSLFAAKKWIPYGFFIPPILANAFNIGKAGFDRLTNVIDDVAKDKSNSDKNNCPKQELNKIKIVYDLSKLDNPPRAR